MSQPALNRSESRPILLTGASGYIGSRVLQRLLAAGQTVVCVQHRRPPPALAGVRLHQADLASVQALDALFAGGVDRVMHLAACSRGTPATLQAANVEATRNLLVAARRAGVRHFIYCSSLDAVHPLRTDYGDSKRAAEALVATSGLPYSILRPALVYGEQGGALETLARFARRWHIYPRPGDGHQLWQPVHVADVADNLCRLLDAEPWQDAIAIAGCRRLPQRAVLAQLLKARNASAWPLPLPVPCLQALAWLCRPLPSLAEPLGKLRLAAESRALAGEADRRLPVTPRYGFPDGL